MIGIVLYNIILYNTYLQCTVAHTYARPFVPSLPTLNKLSRWPPLSLVFNEELPKYQMPGLGEPGLGPSRLGTYVSNYVVHVCTRYYLYVVYGVHSFRSCGPSSLQCLCISTLGIPRCRRGAMTKISTAVCRDWHNPPSMSGTGGRGM
jgi:hypothetical protein